MVVTSKLFERADSQFLMVAGTTQSSGESDGFPVVNAYQSTNKGNIDAFVWVGEVSNSQQIDWQYATFLGGSGADSIYDVVRIFSE